MGFYCPYFVVEDEVLRLQQEAEVVVNTNFDRVEGLGVVAGVPVRN